MQRLTPPDSLYQYFPHPLHFSLFNSSKTQCETHQLHAFSLKSGVFAHPSISSRILSLYADPGINHLPYARSVFDRIHEPSLLLWNLIIKCYVQNQRSHDAIELFSRLLHDFVPDNFTLPSVIKGCARLFAIEEGKQIHGLLLKLGFDFDKYVQSSLVSLYSKCGQIDLARKVFDAMDHKDLVSWNSLIDGYARCGKVELAMELFEIMPEKDSFSWTALVDGFAKCGRVEAAREVFDKIPEKNLVSWNAMINGYMKSGNFDLANQLFNQMLTRDLITWNSMIAGYELNGRFREALEIFDTMLVEEDFKPNSATLVGVISAISGLAVLSKGKWVHSYMIKNGIELDGLLGTLLIDMYSKCGSIEGALKVFQAIANKKVGHWTAIIVGLSIHGKADQALELFNKMCMIGEKPQSITFIGVLNACSHAGLVDKGREYFRMMVDYQIEHAMEHYGCLVDALCRAGHLEEAKNFIQNMPMTPNKVIWMSLLSGARIYGNMTIGEYAARRLMEMSPETIGSYVVLSNMYAATGKWNKVSEVREMMKKRGFQKDPGCSSIEHRGVVHDFIVGDRSHPQTKEIYSKLSEMREKLILAGHVPDTTQVLLCIDEEEEKEAELENHSERLAIAFGLININPRNPIRIVKNLRVCNDCHSVTKLLSEIYSREIIVRDNNRFHHFRNGSCSCNDFW